MPPIIRIENLSKSYRIVHGQPRASYRTFREALTDLALAPLRRLRGGPGNGKTEEFWALKDVSLEVQQGEVLGIIGRNGAGKSTLLKILSRITPPTSGRAEIRGRVGSLLEVGTGFHPELTGRENIYLNGAILGMRRREIQRKFDEIVDFSGIEKFLDTPVKRYSSGMYVRLAFAVAAHLDPEILLVDEVLAVGDAQFQRKCLGKMGEIARGGRTIVFVSHNMGAVRTLCTRAILLQSGVLTGVGTPGEQVAAYLSELDARANTPLADRTDREGNGAARLTGVSFLGSDGQPVDHVLCGDPLKVAVTYTSQSTGQHAVVALSFFSSDGVKLFHVDNTLCGVPLPPLGARGSYSCHFPKLPLPPGRYQVNAMIRVGGIVADHVYSAAAVDILPGDFFRCGRTCNGVGGAFLVDHSWR